MYVRCISTLIFWILQIIKKTKKKERQEGCFITNNDASYVAGIQLPTTLMNYMLNFGNVLHIFLAMFTN